MLLPIIKFAVYLRILGTEVYSTLTQFYVSLTVSKQSESFILLIKQSSLHKSLIKQDTLEDTLD
jgi:hypothetical protein